MVEWMVVWTVVMKAERWAYLQVVQMVEWKVGWMVAVLVEM